jgi:hypothetical protein
VQRGVRRAAPAVSQQNLDNGVRASPVAQIGVHTAQIGVRVGVCRPSVPRAIRGQPLEDRSRLGVPAGSVEHNSKLQLPRGRRSVARRDIGKPRDRSLVKLSCGGGVPTGLDLAREERQ